MYLVRTSASRSLVHLGHFYFAINTEYNINMAANAGARRGHYNQVSDPDRNRIIDAFENGGDYLTVAETLGIKRQTARSVIVTYRRDNARPHVNAILPDDVENIGLRRTPPWSPFLNPVEMAHSCLKAGIKRTLAQPGWQQRVGDHQAAADEGLNMQAWRARLLVEAAQENIDVLTPEKCTRWFNHSQTYLARCLAREEIDG